MHLSIGALLGIIETLKTANKAVVLIKQIFKAYMLLR